MKRLIFDSHLHLTFTKEQHWEPLADVLRKQMDLHGITHTCVMGSARFSGDLYPNEDDMKFQAKTLAEMASKYEGVFYPLLHINPLLPLEFLTNLVEQYIVRGPICGIKFSITMLADDERLDPFYEFLVKYDIPVLFHSWYKTVQRFPDESTPKEIAGAAAKHPSLRILMAHLTACKLRGIQDIKPYPNVFIDTSGSQPENGYLERAIAELGPDRVLFGSDYPIRSFATSLARIDSIELNVDTRQKILFDNAFHFYTKGDQHESR